MSSGDGGDGGDAPAGGGDALRRRPTLRVEDEAGDAARLGGQLQAAGGGGVEVIDLAQHGRQRRGPQALLHGPQAIGRPPRGDDDESRRIEAEGDQPGRIEIELGLAPQNGAAGGETAEQRGAKTEGGAIARGSHDLMQATAGQAAAEGRVDGGQAESQRRPCLAPPLEGLQTSTQFLQLDGLVRHIVPMGQKGRDPLPPSDAAIPWMPGSRPGMT